MEPGAKKVEQKQRETLPSPLSPEQLRRIVSGHRALKLLVLGQGIAIIVLFCLVAGTIAYRLAIL